MAKNNKKKNREKLLKKLSNVRQNNSRTKPKNTYKERVLSPEEAKKSGWGSDHVLAVKES